MRLGPGWARGRASRPGLSANPLFTALTQPGIGEYLAPGLPFSVDGQRSAAVASPALGDDTAAVLSDLGIAADELSRLCESGTVATGSAE